MSATHKNCGGKIEYTEDGDQYCKACGEEILAESEIEESETVCD